MTQSPRKRARGDASTGPSKRRVLAQHNCHFLTQAHSTGVSVQAQAQAQALASWPRTSTGEAQAAATGAEQASAARGRAS